MAGRQISLVDRVWNSLEYRTGRRLRPLRFPDNVEELQNLHLFTRWWYYSIELLPGLITKGIYPLDLPMLPRLMLRKCELADMSCLDMGSMEGLIPVLMSRGGASKVLAIDAVDHCVDKLEAVKHYQGVNFDYRSVGLMYELYKKLPKQGFDLINCSGLLYHVFSPLLVLRGLRQLLKRNGLIIVSTNVIVDDSYTMEFNNQGKMQVEPNTFWYVSVKLFDYLLRYLKLAPMDCLFIPHTAVCSEVKYVFDKPSGYLSVLCRASDEVLATHDDDWMSVSARGSWEYRDVSTPRIAERQAVSRIKYKGEVDEQYFRDDIDCLDLWEAVTKNQPVTSAGQPSNSHILRLADQS